MLSMVAVSMAGCAQMMPTLDAGIGEARKVNDAALQSAEFIICQGAPVGAIRRNYGSPEKAAAWIKLCNPNDQFTPVGDGSK